MSSVAEFLLERMEHAGIKHVYGVPGDYVLNFYNQIYQHPSIEIINTCDEIGAGYAADAYARVNGIGCACVTYNVGALKLANAVACAYAERSPLVVISGSPGIKERAEGVLLHHMVRSFECQKEIFANITCASIVLDDPSTAGYAIDNAFEMLQHRKQPIYIELPRDIADKCISYDVYKQGTPSSPSSDTQNLEEALKEVLNWLSEAENPMILAGVQLARFGLGSELVKFAERANIPIATTLLSKSTVGERHPLFVGVYAGRASRPIVRDMVEKSDCLLMFGEQPNDMTLSFMPAKFTKRQTVNCSIEEMTVRNHSFAKVNFLDFAKALFKSSVPHKRNEYRNSLVDTVKTFEPQPGAKLTATRFFEKINSILQNDMAVIADIGDALFGAADLVMHHHNQFLSPAFYTSMGFAIPAALGVQTAKPEVRPIVLVGDGAFQMSLAELSTIQRRDLSPIVFVLNNGGYNTERYLLDGPFNDVANWNYDKVTEVFGGEGATVETEEELNAVCAKALKSNKMFVINALIKDVSPAMKRMADGLSKRI